MAINDTRPVMAAPYGAATQMTEAFSKLAIDWWRAQSERLFDETAPWNFGLYVARRMMDLTLRPVAVTEEERDYKVEAQIPGIRPRDLDIRVSEGTLRICAEANAERVNGGGLSSGDRFEREIPLPVNADAERATAEVQDGKLTVTLPKQPRPRDHKVAVKPAA